MFEPGSILDPTKELPVLRKFVYCQSPNVYEIDGCPRCKGHNITWSEYVDHIWCFDCSIDYVPVYHGIFDGPIPINLTQMLGISLDRVEIATGRVVPWDSEELARP